MNCEVKTYKFTCDYCLIVEYVRDVPFFDRPEGWHLLKSDDCGSTGYSKNNDCCPDCFHKHEVKMRNKAFW